MKWILVGLITMSGIAIGQESNRSSFAPIVAVSRYTLDDQPVTGPTVGLRYQSREFASSRLGLYAGATFRPNGSGYYQSEPFLMYNTNPYQPYRMQPPIYGGAGRTTRYEVGLAFFGFDWRVYLAEGDVRPYVGLGAQLISWTVNQTFSGTVTPDLKTGLDIRLTSGFNGFIETQYSTGMPTMFGSQFSTLKNVFMVAIGVSFAPKI
jgi:hypothetical protein